MPGNSLKDVDFNPVIYPFQGIVALEKTQRLSTFPRH